jgi:hypothetical protein
MSTSRPDPLRAVAVSLTPTGLDRYFRGKLQFLGYCI